MWVFDQCLLRGNIHLKPIPVGLVSRCSCKKCPFAGCLLTRMFVLRAGATHLPRAERLAGGSCAGQTAVLLVSHLPAGSGNCGRCWQKQAIPNAVLGLAFPWQDLHCARSRTVGCVHFMNEKQSYCNLDCPLGKGPPHASPSRAFLCWSCSVTVKTAGRWAVQEIYCHPARWLWESS